MNSKDILGEFVDQRVLITGRFDKFGSATHQGTDIHTTLLQDAYLVVEGVNHDIGHRWVQYSNDFKRYELRPGSKIKCSCRVKQYKKYADATHRLVTGGTPYEIKYSLSYPTEIEIVSDPPQLTTPRVAPVARQLVDGDTHEGEIVQADNTRMLGKKRCPHCSSVVRGTRTLVCPSCGRDTPPKKKATDTLGLPVDVRAARPESTSHNLDKLSALQNLLRTLGGVPQTKQALTMIDSLGGTVEVRRFLNLL
jgi:hypothetical protein